MLIGVLGICPTTSSRAYDILDAGQSSWNSRKFRDVPHGSIVGETHRHSRTAFVSLTDM